MLGSMTTRILRSLWVWLPTLVLAAGCGGGGSTPLTEATFCDQKATKECEGVVPHCVGDMAACKTKRIAACLDFGTQQQMHPSAAARPFRPERANACIAKAQTTYTNSTITPTMRADLDAVCAKVYSGSLKKNDPCVESDNECDQNQNLICDVGFGVCTNKTNVAASANCNNPGETCPATQFCSAGTPRLCTAKAGSGQACTANLPCQDTLRCTGAAGNTTCMDKLASGATCTGDGDCRSTAPNPAPYCDTFNGSICTPGFTPSTNNNECNMAFGSG